MTKRVRKKHQKQRDAVMLTHLANLRARNNVCMIITDDLQTYMFGCSISEITATPTAPGEWDSYCNANLKISAFFKDFIAVRHAK